MSESLDDGVEVVVFLDVVHTHKSGSIFFP